MIFSTIQSVALVVGFVFGIGIFIYTGVILLKERARSRRRRQINE